MPQKELPTGIQRFLDRVTYSCSEPGYVHFRQDVLRKRVGEVADAYENGWDLLRAGAIGQLGDEDANAVDRAAGVWQRLHEVLLGELRAAGQLHLAAMIADASYLRALLGAPTPAPALSIAAKRALRTTCWSTFMEHRLSHA